MNTGKITVVLAGDNGYALPFTVATRSVAATLEPCQHLDLCVLDMGIDAENRARMEASFQLPGVDVIWVDSLVERVANFPNTWPIITRATYAGSTSPRCCRTSSGPCTSTATCWRAATSASSSTRR